MLQVRIVKLKTKCKTVNSSEAAMCSMHQDPFICVLVSVIGSTDDAQTITLDWLSEVATPAWYLNKFHPQSHELRRVCCST